MPRKIQIVTQSGDSPVITEVEAHDEESLTERLKQTPELIPIEDWGWNGPLLVVGRETTLKSGAADLIAVAASGQILVAEFKTGPKNPDFRAALAQAIDYGSDLWGLSYDEFETSVVLRYLQGDRCPAGAPGKSAGSLMEAAKAAWPEWTTEERATFKDSIESALASGAIHYAVVAQRFTEAMRQTAGYLNEVTSGPQFFLVELIRFSGTEIDAFEARTVLSPPAKRRQSSSGKLSRDALLERITDSGYREALGDLIDFCDHDPGLVIRYGGTGISIRLSTLVKPLSIAWAFPDGVTGWMGLTDLTLGFDESAAKIAPDLMPALGSYAASAAEINGSKPVTVKNLLGATVPAGNVSAAMPAVRRAVEKLVQAAADVE